MGTSMLKNVSFRAQVPVYQYRMPCGRVFRSETPSLPDDSDKLHWFPCRPECQTKSTDGTIVNGYHAFSHRELMKIEVQPREQAKPEAGNFDGVSRARKIGDPVLARRIDEAIVRDRAAQLIRFGGMTADDAAADLSRPVVLAGVEVQPSTLTRRTVIEVGKEIGVYRENGQPQDEYDPITEAAARVEILRNAVRQHERDGRRWAAEATRHSLEAAETRLRQIMANRARVHSDA